MSKLSNYLTHPINIDVDDVTFIKPNKIKLSLTRIYFDWSISVVIEFYNLPTK